MHSKALGGLVSGEPWQQRISLSEETLFNSATNLRARRLSEQKIEYAQREHRLKHGKATKDDFVWGYAKRFKSHTQYGDFLNSRNALLKGDMAGAQAGVRWLEQGPGAAFEGLATLELVTLPPEQTLDGQWSNNYIRQLDLETAVATARFTTQSKDGSTTLYHARESFVSAVDDVMVIQIRCSTRSDGAGSGGGGSGGGCANVRARLKREGSKVERIVAGGRRTLLLQRRNLAPNTMAYAACLRVVGVKATETNEEGELLAGFGSTDHTLTVLVAGTTSYRFPADSVGVECRRRLDSAELVGVDGLRARHVNDYAKYFSRSRLHLQEASYLDSPSGAATTVSEEKRAAEAKQAHKAIKRFRCPSNGRIPTKERVARLGQACTLDNHAVPPGGAPGVAGTSTLGAASSRNARIVDPDLLGLTYSYSRYLLISSSRPGTKPANLQGIWADGMNAPWNGDYHLNINLQMSYWGVFAANLVEMAAPIAPFIQDLAIDGRRVAKTWYNASGWVAHGFTDISGRAGSMAS